MKNKQQLLLILLFTTITMASEMKDSQDYKNLQKYLTDAQSFAAKGDVKKMAQRLKYAEMFMAKLKKKGFESELNTETKIINKISLNMASNKTHKKKPLRNSSQKTNEKPKDDLKQYQQEYNFINKYDPKGHGLNRILHWANHGNAENYQIFKDFNKKEALSVISILADAQDTDREIHNLKNKAQKMQKALIDFDRNIERYATVKRIDNVIKNIKSAQNKDEFNNNLDEIIYFIKTILLISPNHSELTSKLATIESLASNQDKVLADNNKPVDNRKFSDSLPKAIQHDAALEQQILESLQKVYHVVIEFKSVILTSDEWIETKTPTQHYRSMDAVLTGKHIGKHAELGCFYQYFDLRQHPNGNGGWGKAGRNSSGERFYIDCNKL